LRISGYGKDEVALKNQIEEQVIQLRSILGDAILYEEDMPLELFVAQLLKTKNWKIATAESCTGGYISHTFTKHLGSSEYFQGAVVAYSNDVKIKVLGVDPDMLRQKGAVSVEVVEQMAKGVLNATGADVAVATSGIAGPDGATETKTVGTICIAVATRHFVVSNEFKFGAQRDQNIIRTFHEALLMVCRVLLD
jgi:nicotinamide-nucleotide amidase